ncbi:response regulator [Spirosoma sp. HMF4905]|uniref:Response regulator n=1 Tax=Spirosoma arboris TaxID=2682092 RepID=A0A7K1SIW0_9BACT|nr:LytTR family DNA-binding domain-containing protein [Spirosoma arboris]MVM33759.1 response regulator [Spirosoma arboris]
MNVVIIEDETLSAQRLEVLINAYDASIQVLAMLSSVAEAVEWFRHQTPANLPDLVFMDIHLEDGSAFGLIEKIKLTIPIIFTTAYETYAIQAFKANSIDYLLKPIDEDELAAAIDKFKWTQQKQRPILISPSKPLLSWQDTSDPLPYKDRFMVTVGTKIKSIGVDQIAYFFYEEKTTYLTTQDEQTMVVEYSLDKVTSTLNPHQFFRVNRAYLVSLSAIQSIHTYSGSKLTLKLHPTPRHDVFVSPDRLHDFKKWLGK